MAAQTLSVTDPKANNSAGINLSTATYTTMVSGAGNGLEYQWEGTSAVVLKYTGVGTASFTFTVPSPAGTGLAGIGSVPTPKVYSVASGEILYVPNADAFRDPTTGKVTFISNSSSCSALAIAQ